MTALVLVLIASELVAQSTQVYDAGHHTLKVQQTKMGSLFEITVVDPDPVHGEQVINDAFREIDRIESLISSWRDDSETSRINAQAGIAPVVVTRETFDLVARSQKVSKLTNGAFDITIGSVLTLWDFKTRAPAVPDASQIQQALKLVDYRLIELDLEALTVFLPRKGMRLGLGAIGKGYAANRAAALIRAAGIMGGVVNAGGDLFVFGKDGDDLPWKISIAHPREGNRRLAELRLLDQAIVTSGDYERFFKVNGERYSHIIDPRTGSPTRSLQSATLICPDAEVADALATALFVLGVEGLDLVDRLTGFSAIVVDWEGEVHMTRDLKIRLGNETP